MNTLEANLDAAEATNAQLRKHLNPRWYPTFHIAAPAGWINDPNGLSYFQGRYQVFFQHYPADSSWGTMHWGHVTSPDLVHFSRAPIALAPSIEEDRDGVFSGSAVTGPDGNLEVFYTGHRWRNGRNEDDGNIQVQCRATSQDGVHFSKHGTVVEAPEALAHFRDPKVFYHEGTWFMVFGTCSADNRGQVHLYHSADLKDWQFDQVIFQDPDPNVFMLECPDLFPLATPQGAQHWVLTYCPMGKKKTGYLYRNDHTAGYVVGDWAPGRAFTARTEFTMQDFGNEFYAPQSFATPDGRRVQFGWMGSFTVPAAPQLDGDGWFGQLTIPRELTLTENLRLDSAPIAEFTGLRAPGPAGDHAPFFQADSITVEPNHTVEIADDAGPCELELTLDRAQSTAVRAGVLVHHTAPGRGTYIACDEQSGRLVVDRRTTGGPDLGYRAAELSGGKLRLRIFIDRGSVEVFGHDEGGASTVLSSYSFPADGPRAITLLAESGTAVLRDVTAYSLDTIWSK
ncbi:hypothetical protein CATYP_09300 [Corynebacterium atypicum]|uniref:beta-fructofuranosidase n=1 Tax=Corynebacterium atypicum TaxID=191610 RepID=A0ABN4DE38_9CORY|nr:GH32 C-terminal domain-containing protein [Corynebacterium atypicum]AIG64718.1 hypothetical protein CATYP_09300 [Corynebacterium atypicum]